MGRIFLLRHARAMPASPGMRDFDRPLAPSGIADAKALGRALLERGLMPDAVRCSPARRTRETWSAVSEAWPEIEVEFPERLYESGATAYLFLARATKARSVMLVGHNPATANLAFTLLSQGQTDHSPVRAGFPTAGLAVIDFEGELAAASEGAGRLVAFLSPDNLRGPDPGSETP